MVPILKVTRQPPDNIDDYRQEFGYLGPALHGAVTRARSQSTTQAASTGGISSAACKDCVTHSRSDFRSSSNRKISNVVSRQSRNICRERNHRDGRSF
jgi:hypothetical protein